MSSAIEGAKKCGLHEGAAPLQSGIADRLWVGALVVQHGLHAENAKWRRRLATRLGLPLRHGDAWKRSDYGVAGAPGQYAKPLPKLLWCFWAQGEDQAPRLVRECIDSWRARNPGWSIHLLDKATVGDHVEMPAYAYKKGVGVQHFSDILRIYLLERHGGVWADATAYCLRPLDHWLPSMMQADFFGFSNCGRGRPLANWFLASQPGSALIASWRRCVDRYWSVVDRPHQYFCHHQLFVEALKRDGAARHLYGAMPKLEASGAHAIQRFAETAETEADLQSLQRSVEDGCIPVAKLSRWRDGSDEHLRARLVLKM